MERFDPKVFTLLWSIVTVMFILLSSVSIAGAARWIAKRCGKNQMFQCRTYAGYLFASPWIVGFLIFVLGPTLASLYWSFTRYSLPDPPRWVGLQNYVKLLVEDNQFRISLLNSLYMAIFGVPAQILAALGLALLLNQRLRGERTFRLIFYLPVILATNVAMLITWRLMFNSNNGLINTVLEGLSGAFAPFGWLLRGVIFVTELSNAAFIALQRGSTSVLQQVWNAGFPGPDRIPLWNQSQLWTKPAIIVILVWSAGMMMMIYLAALNNVPRELYEAAGVDGANAWKRFRHITLPLITPATFYNLIVGMIAMLQIFEHSYILTPIGGGPANSTYFIAYYLWRATFRFNQIGYGAAMSWILLGITLILTLVQFRLANRWVYYEAK